MYSAGMRMEAGIVVMVLVVVGLMGDGVAGALLGGIEGVGRGGGERKVEEKRKMASEVLLAPS